MGCGASTTAHAPAASFGRVTAGADARSPPERAGRPAGPSVSAAPAAARTPPAAAVASSISSAAAATEGETPEQKATVALAANPDRLNIREAFIEALRPISPGGDAPMAVIKGSWILQQAKLVRSAQDRGDEKAIRELAIRSRQKMPPEAFMLPDDVERYSAELDAISRMAAGAMSYCWETKAHPDPACNSLLAMADAIEECYRKKRDGDTAYKAFPEEFGIFWDYPCLFQHLPGERQRNEEENRLFKWALSNLDLVYAHKLTTIWRLVDSAPSTRPSYAESGWTTYESAAARILKVVSWQHWSPVITIGEEMETASEHALNDAGINAADPWKPIRAAMPPPLTITEFRMKVETLHFTNGSDRSIVADLYEQMLRTALGGAVKLEYRNAQTYGWDDAMVSSFAESLPLCTRLERLSLVDNPFGSAGLIALVHGLRQSGAPNLVGLHLSWNQFGDEGVFALAEALTDGMAPNLRNLDLGLHLRAHTHVAVTAAGESWIREYIQKERPLVKL